MAIYTIFRVYEMPADSLQQATDRMAEAIVLHVEKDFHVKDIVREPGAEPRQVKQVDLRPATSWLAIALEQLGVARRKKEVACLPTRPSVHRWRTGAGELLSALLK